MRIILWVHRDARTTEDHGQHENRERRERTNGWQSLVAWLHRDRWFRGVLSRRAHFEVTSFPSVSSRASTVMAIAPSSTHTMRRRSPFHEVPSTVAVTL